MKSRIFFVLTAVCVMLAAFCFSETGNKTGSARVLQHQMPLPEDECPEGELVTHLPIISIETNDQKIPGSPKSGSNVTHEYETGDNGELEIYVSVSVVEENGNWNTLGETPSFFGNAALRYRGNSSRNFDKKSYLIKLADEEGQDEEHSLMGMSPASKWVLNGPFLDRTLIRNYMCYSIAGMIMDYAPNVRYCELVLDGEYQGVYLLTEAITKGEGRIDLTEPESNSAMTSWLVRIDRENKADVFLNTFSFYTNRLGVSGMDLLYPGENTITQERYEYVEQEISTIEHTLYSADIDDPQNGISSYIDMRAFARYFVINEFFGNVDAGRFSTYLYKDIRGKVTPVVWDFNNACDNYISDVYDGGGFNMLDSPWFDRLVYDKVFVDMVIEEYRSLRKSYLNTDYLTEFIDDTVEYLGDAIDRNYEVWGYVFEPGAEDDLNYLVPKSRNYYSYEDAVEQLKYWIAIRGGWLDDHIDTLRQYCADSKNENRSLN